MAYASYIAKGTYNDKGLDQEDRDLISQYQSQWNAANEAAKEAKEAGDTAAYDAAISQRDQAHANAEAVRSFYGYSGGDDGSEYIPIAQQTQQPQSSKPQTQPSSYDLTDYIKSQKAAELEASLNNLESAYRQSVNGYDQRAALLPQTYDSARRAAAAQSAQQQTAFDERALAQGLSSGARAQAQLSRSSQVQSALAGLDQQEANAQSDIDLARANLDAQYQNAVANAKANNDASLSTAMYNELVRQNEAEREMLAQEQERAERLAQIAAGYGDYSLLNELGVDTGAYESRQAQLDAQYAPTFTQAQVIAAKKDADSRGTQLTGNMLRDYYYYFYGDPNAGGANYGGTDDVPTGGTGMLTQGGKTVDELAQEVIAGRWGNGADRAAALAAAGYDAAAVQAAVNAMLPNTTRTPTGNNYDGSGTSGGMTVDMQSVLSLGYGPISEDRLAQLVNSGQVEEYVDGNKIKFRKK